MSKPKLLTGVLGIVVVCLNLIPFHYSSVYHCINGDESFNDRFSFRGLPLPYVRTYLHGDCTRIKDAKEVATELDYRMRILWGGFIIDGVAWISLLAGAYILMTKKWAVVK